MRILFVCSGNSDKFEISPFIRVQADSLLDLGHEVDFHRIVGKGLRGYLRNIPVLHKAINQQQYDLVHAHYSLCGIVAWLASLGLKPQNAKPGKGTGELSRQKPRVVVSLLGSDVNGKCVRRVYIRLLSFFWASVIVKSDEMKQKLALKRALVIPNGVSLNTFKPIQRQLCRSDLELDQDTKYILFAADPGREVKNFPLAKAACLLLTTKNYQLISLGDVPHTKIPIYINACNVLILTSLWEGSPNIVKEAMACNVPIVSTPVGDVKWLFGNLEGYYLADPTPEAVAAKLEQALEFSGRTQGRNRLIELGLDSETVAKRIVEVYKEVLSCQ